MNLKKVQEFSFFYLETKFEKIHGFEKATNFRKKIAKLGKRLDNLEKVDEFGQNL